MNAKLAVALAAVMLVHAGAAVAATHHVTIAAGDGPGTLPNAIASAASGDTVVIDRGVDPVVDHVVITRDLVLEGQGASETTIRGNGQNDVLRITSGFPFLRRVTISGVTVTGGGGEAGGGIWYLGVQVDGKNVTHVLLRDVAVVDNAVSELGGGIWQFGGALTLDRVTIARNLAGVRGGGIATQGNGSTLVARNSTIVQNSAGLAGGGISFEGGRGVLSSATAAGNSATLPAAIGGNLYLLYGTARISRSIIAGGRASSGGNCAVADVRDPPRFTSGGHNLDTSRRAQCGARRARGDRIGVTARLGPLADYGGLTPTAPPLAGSPAIDAIPARSCALRVDQRGVARPQHRRCDIGAVERRSAVSPR